MDAAEREAEVQPLAAAGAATPEPRVSFEDAGGADNPVGDGGGGLPLELAEDDVYADADGLEADEREAPGEEEEGAKKKKGKFSSIRAKLSKKKGAAAVPGARPDGSSLSPEPEPEPEGGGKKKGKAQAGDGLARVLSTLMHEPGKMTPGEFATTRNDMVKQRQSAKGNRRWRGLVRRELPYYQTHFGDSDKPCVGVAPQKLCRMNPQFADHLEWSLRAACAATVAAGPSFWATIRQEVNWDECHDTLYECTGWAEAQSSYCLSNREFMEKICPYSCREHPGYEQCNHDPGWLPNANWVPDLDPSYAAVVSILAFGYTIGETHRFVWELIAGVIFAAVVPQVFVYTFGASWPVSAIILFLYTFLLICMPIDNMTKKFSLALCVQYMCTRSLWEHRNWEYVNHWSVYHVAKMGIYGALVALLWQFLPWPRSARGEAHRTLNSVGSDIITSLWHMVRGFCDGQTKQQRMKALRYTDHISRQLMELEQSITFAWWERSENKVHKYKVCAATMHSCRANLYGMQQALSQWDNEKNRRDLGDARDTLHEFANCSMQTLDGILHFMVEGDLDGHINQDLEEAESHGKELWNIVRRKITQREGIEKSIRQHIPTLDKRLRKGRQVADISAMEQSMGALNFALTDMRARLAQRDDGERLEEDQWLHVFMASLVSFGQTLIDFPETYAQAHEARHNEAKQEDFIPEAVLVAVWFKRENIVAGLKTATAVVLAFLVNVWLFDFESLATVIVAYVMAGHTGGSYANTTSRCLGVLSALVVSFTFIISTECEPVPLAICFFVTIAAGSYVRISSPTSTYTALVANIVTTQLMVQHCHNERDLQFAMSRQLVLSCFVMAAAELLVYGENSLKHLRKVVAETYTEARVVFVEVFQTNLSDCWANIERKAYIANRFGQGHFEEYKAEERDVKLVDNSLWCALFAGPLSCGSRGPGLL